MMPRHPLVLLSRVLAAVVATVFLVQAQAAEPASPVSAGTMSAPEPVKPYGFDEFAATIDFRAEFNQSKAEREDETTRVHSWLTEEDVTVNFHSWLSSPDTLDFHGELTLGAQQGEERYTDRDHKALYKGILGYDVTIDLFKDSAVNFSLFARRNQETVIREFAGSVDVLTTSNGGIFHWQNDVLPFTAQFTDTTTHQTGSFDQDNLTERERTFEFSGEMEHSANSRTRIDFSHTLYDDMPPGKTSFIRRTRRS